MPNFTCKPRFYLLSFYTIFDIGGTLCDLKVIVQPQFSILVGMYWKLGQTAIRIGLKLPE